MSLWSRSETAPRTDLRRSGSAFPLTAISRNSIHYLWDAPGFSHVRGPAANIAAILLEIQRIDKPRS
jgi:hypothetical protein